MTKSSSSCKWGTLLIVLKVYMSATLETKMAFIRSLTILPKRVRVTVQQWLLLTLLNSQQPKQTATKFIYYLLQFLRELKIEKELLQLYSQASRCCFIFKGIFSTIYKSAFIFTLTNNSYPSLYVALSGMLFEYFTSSKCFSSPYRKDGLFLDKKILIAFVISSRGTLYLTSNKLQANDFQKFTSVVPHSCVYRRFNSFPGITSERSYLKNVSRNKFSMTVLGFMLLQRVLQELCSLFIQNYLVLQIKNMIIPNQS